MSRLPDGSEPVLAVGDAVYWQTAWSKAIPALVVEVAGDRVYVALHRRRQVTARWTPASRLRRSDRTAAHRRLEHDALGLFQRDLFA